MLVLFLLRFSDFWWLELSIGIETNVTKRTSRVMLIQRGCGKKGNKVLYYHKFGGDSLNEWRGLIEGTYILHMYRILNKKRTIGYKTMSLDRVGFFTYSYNIQEGIWYKKSFWGFFMPSTEFLLFSVGIMVDRWRRL